MGLDVSSLPGLDIATGTLVLPLWATGALAGVVIALLILALRRAGSQGVAGLFVRFALLAAAVAFAWGFLDQGTRRDRADERRALQARAMTLTAQALAPGSPLSCLDGAAGDAVQDACERVLFASPESVAAATAYVAARLTLLADGLDFVMRKDANFESELAASRHSIEADRYGFVAYVLATRDGCTPDHCDAYLMLQDAARVRTNLRQQVFDMNVARYAASWPTRAPRSAPGVAAVPGTPSLVPPGFNLPSSASIPPVSIMNAEPPAATSPEPPAPRRPPAAVRVQRPAPSNPGVPPPPVQLAPPATGNPAGVQ